MNKATQRSLPGTPRLLSERRVNGFDRRIVAFCGVLPKASRIIGKCPMTSIRTKIAGSEEVPA